MVSYNQLMHHLYNCRSMENKKKYWSCDWFFGVTQRLCLKCVGITTLTFRCQVTSSVTWSLDSQHAVSCRWSIVTMRLSCTVTET